MPSLEIPYLKCAAFLTPSPRIIEINRSFCTIDFEKKSLVSTFPNWLYNLKRIKINQTKQFSHMHWIVDVFLLISLHHLYRVLVITFFSSSRFNNMTSKQHQRIKQLNTRLEWTQLNRKIMMWTQLINVFFFLLFL